MSKKLLLCFALLIGLVSFAIAQRTVTGTVTDELTKEPLIQATVVIKGTTQGTVTDENGKFKLDNVANNAVLTVSYLDYPKVDINTGVLTEVNVTLKANESEVVIVNSGYLVEEKQNLSGAIAGIKGSTIEGMPAQSFDRAMQGRLAGVQVGATSGQPGGALTIRIRGVGSINAGNDPLYIVDGVQVRSGGGTGAGSSNVLGSINPNDIESIEVLKDAAAAAIYGAQAANGVVVITTKRGKKGPSQVNFSIQEGIVQPMNLYNVMNSNQFAQIKQAAYLNANSSTLPLTGMYQLYGDPNNPNLPSYNWVDAVFRTGRQSTYDVNITGGDEKTNFYISAGYSKQEGQVIRTDWSRGVIKANFTHRASDKLTIGANINASWQRTQGAGENGYFTNAPFTATFALPTYYPGIKVENGVTSYPDVPNVFAYRNIVQYLNEEERTGKTFQFIGSTNIGYKLTQDLTLNALGGIDFLDIRTDNQRPATLPGNPRSVGGTASIGYTRLMNFNMNVNAQYTKKINQVHNISGIIGAEYKIEQQETGSAAGQGFANIRLRSLQNAATPTSVGGAFTEYKRIGFFGKAKYDYMDKYYVEFTLRRDGSSRFGSNNRFGNFYAVAGGWRFTSESFFPENVKKILEEGKIRVSYGVLGNSEIGNFASRTLFGTQTNSTQYNGLSLVRPTGIGNDLLAWESQRQLNIGLDFQLLKGRIYGSIDYWRKISYDLLLAVPLPADAGAGYDPNSGTYSVQGNAGRLLNTGLDIELTSVNIDYKGFKWLTSFNISTLKNELLELPNGQKRIGNSYIVGQPLNFIWGSEFVGVNPANGRIVVLDTLGNPSYQVNNSTDKVLAKGIPSYYGGLNNSFSYKGITLDIFFQYQVGNSAYLGDLYILANGGTTGENQLVSQLAYWQKPGDITNVPRPVQGGTVEGTLQSGDGTSRFVSDASYIRLKQIRLAYEVPSEILSKFKVRRVNVYAQAINLWTYTKFAGIDPEVVGQVSSNTPGTGDSTNTFGTYPVGRQFNVGLVFGF